MEKINIAKLLKDCPSGMELDCTMYNKVTLLNVDDREDIVFPIKLIRKDGNSIALTKYGQYTDAEFAKCVIFPKGKTTWEGFQRPIVDGDILSYQHDGFKNRTIYIYMYHNRINTTYYVALSGYSGSEFLINYKEGYALNGYNDTVRFASEEEKDRLFQAIKDNGYKWNAEKKTLEKLNIQEFKDGDIVTCNDRGSLVACIYKGRKNTASFNHHIALYKGGLGIVINGEIVLTDDELSFATEEEKEILFQEIKNNGYKWNVETKTLEKTNKPIFKVGQKIKIKNDSIIEIREITDYYYISTNGCKFEIKYQDNYELMPNKFDISSLIPFESKVLVRSENHNIWKPAIFGFFVESNKNFYVLGGTCWTQCIPYKGNEYLFKTTDDCNEYYKTWEK